MARIRSLVSVAGDPGWSPGQVVEVDEPTAAAWCDGERAVRVDEPAVRVDEPAGTKAVAPPPGPAPSGVPAGEKAVAPPSGRQASRRTSTAR